MHDYANLLWASLFCRFALPSIGDALGGTENAGLEKSGLENVGPNRRVEKIGL